MKTKNIFTAAFIACLTLSSCSSKSSNNEALELDDSAYSVRAELQELVDRENAKPHKPNSLYTIDQLELTDDALEYYVSLTDEGAPFYDELAKSGESSKDFVLSALKNDPALLEVCEMLSQEGMGLTWIVYMANEPGKKVTIKLDSNDISDIQAYEGSPESRAKQQFADMAQNIAKSCPDELDEGLTMVDCKFANNELTYIYDCTGEYYDYITANLMEWKSDLKSQLTEGGEMFDIFLANCAKNGVLLCYEYRNKATGAQTTIKFDPMLKKFIK